MSEILNENIEFGVSFLSDTRLIHSDETSKLVLL